MTVKELIENLKEYDETLNVAVYDSYMDNVFKVEGIFKCSNTDEAVIEISINNPCTFG